ncbi:hypothetical protein ACTMTI_31945 [Nonomuraea sp. H19]|uniref:hypothetical protein n=1 Tax=Nonomuraea sp. H19 TaxID=3452206 RepID=UPI003F889C18
MLSAPRRITTVAIVAGGLTLLAAPAAHAVVDPVGLPLCAAGAVLEITTVVDPANPGVPAEVPVIHCLHP